MSIFSFTPKTVDDAIAGLLKAQADLKTVAENRRQSANDRRSFITELETKATADEAEAIKALAVLDKLTAITGG